MEGNTSWYLSYRHHQADEGASYILWQQGGSITWICNTAKAGRNGLVVCKAQVDRIIGINRQICNCNEISWCTQLSNDEDKQTKKNHKRYRFWRAQRKHLTWCTRTDLQQVSAKGTFVPSHLEFLQKWQYSSSSIKSQQLQRIGYIMRLR